MNTQLLLKLIAASAYQLHYTLLMGSQYPVPYLIELNEEIQNPQPGDYVIEVAGINRTDKEGKWDCAIGRLILARNNFVHYKDSPGGFLEHCTYLEDLDGHFQRWLHGRFVKLLPQWNLGRSTTSLAEEMKEKSDWVIEALKRHKFE